MEERTEWRSQRFTRPRVRLLASYLFNATLSNADLTGADLTDADLRGTDLTDADLRRTDLTDAELTGADLRFVKNFSQNQLDSACADSDCPPMIPDDMSWEQRTCPKVDATQHLSHLKKNWECPVVFE